MAGAVEWPEGSLVVGGGLCELRSLNGVVMLGFSAGTMALTLETDGLLPGPKAELLPLAPLIVMAFSGKMYSTLARVVDART